MELKRQYDLLVGQNLAGVFRTTLDGRFLECNDAMARIFGYADREELMAQPATVLYVDSGQRGKFLEALRTHGRLVNFELNLRHRAGGEVHVLENVWLDAEGDPVTVQGTVVDITRWKRTEQEREHLMRSYRDLVERVRAGLLVLVDDTVRFANPAATALCGPGALGRPVAGLFHGDDGPALVELLRTAVEEGRAGPAILRLENGHGIMVMADRTRHDERDAVQLTLHDHHAQDDLAQERQRARMAEEVNEVLRKEIREHRRTQEALRRSKRFSRILVDSSLDMIMAADTRGLITEFNPAATLRFGWEANEVLGRNTRMLYADPADYERVQGELGAHGVFAGEIANITRDGEVFTTYLAASRLHDEDGQPIGAMGVSRDITGMKRDQEALRASEERYRDLFENATDLIQSVDPEGRFQYVNAAWCGILGYTPEQARSMCLWDLLHPDHLERTRELYQKVFEGREATSVDTVLLARDGREVHVEGRTNARLEDGRVVATRGIFRDVTDVRRERLRAQAQEAKLRALFESSEHMFWTVDPAIRLTSFNKGYAEMIDRLHGVRPLVDTDHDRPRRKFASEEYHRFWEERYAEAFIGKPLRFETDLLDQRGERVCNEIFLSPVFDEHGAVGEVFGVGHEITELKRAEEQVREQSARLKAIFDSSANMMIWTLDPEFRITSCNEHFLRSIEEQHGIRFNVGDPFVTAMATRVVRGRSKPLVDRYKAAMQGRPQQFEVEMVNTQGHSVWVENFLNPIHIDGEVRELSCLAYGITDRKEAQLELERSLAEKEILLKEVHHRVKNNLQIVSSIFNLQTSHVGDDQRVLGLLQDSRHRILSMSYIHESIYLNKDLSSVDLAGYIEGLGRNLIMGYDVGGKVRLETELEPVELGIDDAIPCGLILNELISNALKHAFGSEGGIIRVTLATSGSTVRIGVEDNGTGLPPGVGASAGGNLGLDLVRTLAGQLNAELVVASDKGAAFSLTFERTK